MIRKLVRPIQMPSRLKVVAVINGQIDQYHSVFVGDLINRYAYKLGQRIPKEDDDALLLLAADALSDFLSVHPEVSEVKAEYGTVYRTVEIFNWHTIHWLLGRVEEDPKAIDKLFETVQQQYYRKFENEHDACAAFALGILSLEGLYVVLSKLLSLEIRECLKKEYAVKIIRTITESFYVMDCFLGEDWSYITIANVDQIESIMADLYLFELEDLNHFVSIV